MAGRTAPCSLPRTGSKSARTMSPAFKDVIQRYLAARIFVVYPLARPVRTPIAEFRPVLGAPPVHLRDDPRRRDYLRLGCFDDPPAVLYRQVVSPCFRPSASSTVLGRRIAELLPHFAIFNRRLHPLGAAVHRRHAGTAHLDKSERLHDGYELLDLRHPPGDFEDEVFGVGIDHAGAEGVSQPQCLDAIVASAAHLDECQLALDGPLLAALARDDGQVHHPVYRNDPLELVADL